MRKSEGDSHMYPLISDSEDDYGHEDDAFDDSGPRSVVVQSKKSIAPSEMGMSTVTVMPAMRLTWSSICAKPKTIIQPESSFLSQVTDCLGFQKKPPKEGFIPRQMILKDCFGVAYPGEVLALMGASGAGKTTLMNILTQRNLGTVVTSGKIRINDVDVDKSILRKLSAYVQQDDLFIGTMTVAEHLHFTALMKMGKNYSAREQNRRVKMVMADLNLTKCANTLIGNHRRGIKGISGGERKRLDFASEIMTSPPLLFCDEPTSGLDSHMARHTIEVLKQLAQKKNMTIICTIHQPSSQVFAIFDRVCFIAEGKTAFHGTIQEAMHLWKSIGDPAAEKSNPADHFVSSLAILSGKKLDASKKRVSKICDAFMHSNSGKAVYELVRAGDTSPDNSLDDIWQNNDKLKEKTYQKYKATWKQQFTGLFRRSLLGNMRDPVVLQVRIFQTIVIALIMGFVYFDTKVSQNTVMNINGGLFQIVMNMNFMFQFTAVHMFCNELPTFLRENQANMYRPLPYFLAVNLAEGIQYVVYPTVFACISYWLSGYVRDVGAFLIFTLVCVLVTNTALSVSYMMSCIFGLVSVAVSVMPIIVVPMMAFGGFYININSLPSYFVPLGYLSYFKYGFEALIVNEWSRIDYIGECGRGQNTTCYSSGNDVIRQLGFNPGNLWIDVFILIIMTVVLRSLAFLALYIRTKTKE